MCFDGPQHILLKRACPFYYIRNDNYVKTYFPLFYVYPLDFLMYLLNTLKYCQESFI